jgi:hypothetical protein
VQVLGDGLGEAVPVGLLPAVLDDGEGVGETVTVGDGDGDGDGEGLGEGDGVVQGLVMPCAVGKK